MKNGDIYEAPTFNMRGIAQRIAHDSWVLLSQPQETDDGGMCMLPIPDKAGIGIYTEEQLIERLNANGWIRSSFTVRFVWRPDLTSP